MSSLSVGALRISRADASTIAEDEDAENRPRSYRHREGEDEDEDYDGTMAHGAGSRHSHAFPRALCEPRNKPIVVKVARVSTRGKRSWVDVKVAGHLMIGWPDTL